MGRPKRSVSSAWQPCGVLVRGSPEYVPPTTTGVRQSLLPSSSHPNPPDWPAAWHAPAFVSSWRYMTCSTGGLGNEVPLFVYAFHSHFDIVIANRALFGAPHAARAHEPTVGPRYPSMIACAKTGGSAVD